MFELLDLARLGLIFFLEAALSFDNAIAIALIVKHLDQKQQKKALWIGFSSALFLRGLAVLGVTYLIHFKWLAFLGGCYLLYLAFSFKKHPKLSKAPSLFRTIILIELTDLALALDSIIAAVGVVGIPPKLWIIYVGGVMGMITMRFTVQGFTKLTYRFPRLDRSAQAIVCLVGVRLLLQVFEIHLPLEEIYFWGLSILCLAWGVLPKSH